MSKLIFIALALVLCTVYADKPKQYADGDSCIVWVNKVGPFRNPQETYLFYSLPFCKPAADVETHLEGLGEALQGYELRASPVDLKYKADVAKTVICKKTLNQQEADEFHNAILNQYWYQLFVDELPVWGMVGEIDTTQENEPKTFIYAHWSFSVSWNGDRIIEVNLTTENPVEVTRDAEISFTYEVTWTETETEFEERFEKYLDYNFFEHQIHWFSIFNSFMMVIFLTGLVSMILMRTLKKDYARYSRDDDDIEDDRDVGDESGWKQVHGDVFRASPNLGFFSALIGTGYQLGVLVPCVILFSILGTFYTDRGTTVTAFIVCYAFTSFIAGYSSGGLYTRNGGQQWIQCMIVTALLFPAICVSIAFFLNFIAIGYGSLAAIPFGTMVAITLIWGFVSVPLTLVGTIVGRNVAGTPDNPCRINPVPRLIPEKKWYMHPIVNIFLGGILPFGSIFIEMYFIFTSFWHYKYYYVYGFMLLVYLILVIVTVCVTIVSTYFLLNSEDYRWQWVSFFSASSTSIYVFLYGVYYFFAKTHMNGFFQTCFYFGYTAMFCIGLGITCGAIGYFGTSIFVKRIYQNVKID